MLGIRAELTTTFEVPPAVGLPDDARPEALDLFGLIMHQLTPCCVTCGSTRATPYDGGTYCDGCRRRVVRGLASLS